LNDKFMHLTNYSLQKYADSYVENRDSKADNVGHKWSFSALNRHLSASGIDAQELWDKIISVVTKTLITVEKDLASRTAALGVQGHCFELLGFDVILDKGLEPKLLEVNGSPSLSAETPLDYKIKSHLLAETFTLAGISKLPFPAAREDGVAPGPLPEGACRNYIRIFPSRRAAKLFRRFSGRGASEEMFRSLYGDAYHKLPGLAAPVPRPLAPVRDARPSTAPMRTIAKQGESPYLAAVPGLNQLNATRSSKEAFATAWRREEKEREKEKEKVVARIAPVPQRLVAHWARIELLSRLSNADHYASTWLAEIADELRLGSLSAHAALPEVRERLARLVYGEDPGEHSATRHAEQRRLAHLPDRDLLQAAAAPLRRASSRAAREAPRRPGRASSATSLGRSARRSDRERVLEREWHRTGPIQRPWLDTERVEDDRLFTTVAATGPPFNAERPSPPRPWTAGSHTFDAQRADTGREAAAKHASGVVQGPQAGLAQRPWTGRPRLLLSPKPVPTRKTYVAFEQENIPSPTAQTPSPLRETLPNYFATSPSEFAKQFPELNGSEEVAL